MKEKSKAGGSIFKKLELKLPSQNKLMQANQLQIYKISIISLDDFFDKGNDHDCVK